MDIGFLGQDSSQSNESAAAFVEGDGVDAEGVTRIGTVVFDSLRSDRFDRARIFTAFARTSGVRQLERALEGTSDIDVELVVGIDHENTSREALERLADLPIDARVYYHTRITYHPKLYYFEGAEHSRLLVGSANLTNQGLNQNVEAAMIVETAAESSAVIDDATSFLDTLAGEATPIDHEVIEQYAALLGTEETPPSTSGGVSTEPSSGRPSVPDELTANAPVQSRTPVIPPTKSQSPSVSADDETTDSEPDKSSLLETDELPPRSELPPIPSVSDFATTTDENYYSQLVNDPENQPSLLRRYIRAKGEVSKAELQRVASEEWGYSLSGSFGASLHVLTDVIDDVDTYRKNGETYYRWKEQ